MGVAIGWKTELSRGNRDHIALGSVRVVLRSGLLGAGSSTSVIGSSSLAIDGAHLLLDVPRTGSRTFGHRLFDASQASSVGFTSTAAAFSSRYSRHLVPGMGTMSSPRCKSQAR